MSIALVPLGHSCRVAEKMVSLGMAVSYPTLIPGLRSPSELVQGVVYFGRMLDKIRLFAAGKLPEGWHAARGTLMKGSFDSHGCRFLQIDYAELERETLKGGTDPLVATSVLLITPVAGLTATQSNDTHIAPWKSISEAYHHFLSNVPPTSEVGLLW